jgi:DNA-binding response OmpR family regulator
MTKVSACQSNAPFVGRSILIVQKQWHIASGLARAFETKGARALLARGAAALELAHDPDLAAAVLDSDSAQLCRLLNEKQIPYVVYSAREQFDDEFARATLIRKPARAEDVVASVDACSARATTHPDLSNRRVRLGTARTRHSFVGLQRHCMVR